MNEREQKLLSDKAFRKWCLKLDMIYIGYGITSFGESIVDITGADAWYPFFADGDSPYYAFIEDMRAGL